MTEIVYYITGHGYGHTTRSIELIRALQHRQKDLFVHIKTDAPFWFFNLNLHSNYTHHNLCVDIGTVAAEAFYAVDFDTTFKRVAGFIDSADALISSELEFVRSVKPDLIIADIPAIAFDIAGKAGLPGIGLGNFSWDWIYRDYVAAKPEFNRLITHIRSSYQKCDLLLRLPFHGDMSVFPCIEDVPLIARRARLSKPKVLQRLGLTKDDEQILVLIAMRAADLSQVKLADLPSDGGFTFITLGLPEPPDFCRNLPPDAIPFQELVNVADLVVSKPGYGIVSEILANRTPLLYTARDSFAEYKVLAQALEKFAVAEEIPRSDFLSGKWQPFLDRLLTDDGEWTDLQLDGAETGAEVILNFISDNM
jgi:L-arabinokinase